jgi:CO/xanthine dehydrogenase FAD-binding subunit
VKPAVFEYDAPEALEGVLDLLREHGDDARILAGGQSLVPLMNFRLVRPARLVDLNNIEALDYVEDHGDTLRIGAMTRQGTLERSPLIDAHCPLVAEALPWIGHPQIRNRGTIGGSIGHADPAAELPAVTCALDARIRVRSATAERWIDADDFFVGFLSTAMEPDELLVEIEIAKMRLRTGTAFVEYARRHGDFALGGAAAVVTTNDDGVCTYCRIVLLAAASTPHRSWDGERALVGRVIDEEALRDVVELVATSIEPGGDGHGSSHYRRSLIGRLAARAIGEANRRSNATL